MDGDPIQGDLVDLIFGRVFVGGPQDDLLRLKSLAVRSTACSGLFVGTISGITFLPASSARETTAVINC